jgi:type I restriction enzyme S subunit
MAVKWRERPLGELTENFDSVRVPVKEAERRVGPYPYYGASGIVDYVDGYLFDGEYLLIAEDGENLRTRNTPVAFLARGKFWVNNHAHIVRGNSESDTRFLMYALAGADISGYLTGSTMPKLTQGNMNRIPLLAPPASEQRAIAHILGTLDDKIELNRRMNETLEAMARALFKSWFVDFLPVRARMAARTQTGDPLPAPQSEAARQADGLPKHLADLFPDSFVDSELGEIPAGWRVGKVGDLAALNRDSLNPGECPDEMFDHFSIPAFDEGRSPKRETGGAIKSNKCIVPPEGVLLSKLNPRIPRIWLPDLRNSYRAVCSTEFLIALPKQGVSREFLFCLFSSDNFAGVFATLVTGTSGSHQRVKREGLLAIDTVIPTEPAILQFTTVAKPLLERISRKIDESRTLAALRDTLLPGLISGELRLASVEYRP